MKAKDVLVSGSGRAIVGGLAGENLTVLWPDRGGAIISSSGADVQVSSQSASDTGGLVGFNSGRLRGNGVSGSAAAVPLAGLNFGEIRN